MQMRSWDSLAPNFRTYAHTEAVGHFVAQATPILHPLALILFGSLARGDYHPHSDADVCVVLPTTPPTPFAGYDQVVACDPSGVVQPVVYGPDQFRQMVRQANGLALEVLADGLFLAGDETFRQEIEQLVAQTRQRMGIERTPTGWRIARPDLIEE
jgi:UTP:GlnB (protein PII) uridylyltransferase